MQLCLSGAMIHSVLTEVCLHACMHVGGRNFCCYPAFDTPFMIMPLAVSDISQVALPCRVLDLPWEGLSFSVHPALSFWLHVMLSALTPLSSMVPP